MIAKHTLTHAIQYLRDAVWSKGSRSTVKMDDAEALRAIGPAKPCAAYGLAKRTLKRCGSLDAAIKDLEKQLEQS
jgi:hypothetical protein